MTEFATAPRPIRTVLIANRGEIACRVIRTCKRLGLSSIAVYSDADADALHARQADQALRIGPASAAESYLSVAAILDAASRSGADAIHPGYGFLSENAGFARACEEAGLIFIGPTSVAIAAMGSKIEAKKIAEASGVPTVPGYLGADQSAAALAEQAARIGFPVLIKASAGGGGRGMRRVDEPEGFAAALQAARAEAKGAFGDDTVLLEKFIGNPRHLEVQLIGDIHGNLVHLFERDCSVQRNNQKVFEEAPAPHVSDAVRTKLFDRALTLGRTIGYTSAGTVEFIMEAGGSEPYFLEMNTRLQVEHPVTEAVTGIDLVQWQIRVAAGLPLPARQDQIRLQGHAIEARIAAERPDRGYQPATGRIQAVHVPRGVRFDTGITAGSEVGPHYDSMIAKLIVHGATRDQAVSALAAGLDDVAILGIGTNTGFLRACVARPDFAAGRLTTGFIAREFPDGWAPHAGQLRDLRAQAALAWAHALDSAGDSPWQRRSAFRVMGKRRAATVELRLQDDYGELDVMVRLDADVPVIRFEDGTELPGTVPAAVLVDGRRVQISRGGLSLDVQVSLAIDIDAGAAADAANDNHVTAPLPGVVTGLFVEAGALVAKGDSLVQMEAMKLVHTLAAPRDGRIARIHCAVGDVVASGAPLIDITADGEE
jgi:acetyl-CoA carboxylase biotin carboxylase subunit